MVDEVGWVVARVVDGTDDDVGVVFVLFAHEGTQMVATARAVTTAEHVAVFSATESFGLIATSVSGVLRILIFPSGRPHVVSTAVLQFRLRNMANLAAPELHRRYPTSGLANRPLVGYHHWR